MDGKPRIELDRIYNQDCFEGMKLIETGTIDLIASDPPYGYSFMGKEWDKLPSVDILKECLRVLKPGAFAFWLMTPRQDCQMEFLHRLKQAGFNIGFSPIYWLYSSGFPKAANISKLVDKKLGFERKGIIKTDGVASNSGSGCYQMNTEGETSMQKVFETGEPVSEQAKQLDGSYAGFQPKPAVEVVVVSMKPLAKKTYVEQALDNSHGITWLDDCRIPIDKEADSVQDRIMVHQSDGKEKDGGMAARGVVQVLDMDKGRFPANILVSDDALNDGTISKGQNGATTGDEPSTLVKGNCYGDYRGVAKPHEPRGDTGSTSRYFSLDAWWVERIKKLPGNVQKVFPFLCVPKASSSERNDGLDDFELKQVDYDSLTRTNKETVDKFGAERKAKMSNTHPTSKPVQLMSYLITLGSRQGDIVLDPFIGSGTTAISARILSRKFIGFERDKSYFEIAEGRIKDHIIQRKLFEII